MDNKNDNNSKESEEVIHSSKNDENIDSNFNSFNSGRWGVEEHQKFIEGILKYTDDVVRIGGRCKNEKVREKILVNDKFSNKTFRGIAKDLENIGEEMKDITSLMDVGRRIDFKYVYYLYFRLLFISWFIIYYLFRY